MTSTTASREIPITFIQKPTFEVVKSIPEHLTPQIESAVRDFIVSSHSDDGTISVPGFYNQTLQCMANATYLGQGGELWLGTLNGQLLIYILALVNTDIDGRLTYHVSQAWVREDYRGNLIVKDWWEAVRKRAKNLFCSHLVIVSSRGHKAYERFLGHGLKLYAHMLKEEL